MAIYHLSFKICKRSDGKSSVYLSAYQNRQNIKDNRTGATWDYSKKPGFDGSLILAPATTPEWLIVDSATLWNAVESTEKRKDAQLSRYFDVALPKELDNQQKKDLVIKYCQENFVDAGMIVDIAFHDLDSENPHAHVMLTMREITPDGFGKKVREWNDNQLLESWRKNWEKTANLSLKEAGSKSRIDSRSLEDQRKHAERNLSKAKTSERIAFYQAKLIELDRSPMKRIHRNDWQNGRQLRELEQKEKKLLLNIAKKHYFNNRNPSTPPVNIKSKIKPLYQAIKNSFQKALSIFKVENKPKEPVFESSYIIDSMGNHILKSEYENYDKINSQKIKQQLENKKSAESDMREHNRNLNRPKVKKEISSLDVDVSNSRRKLKR
ncbi:MobQ family relaxase [Enterobacter cloacae]|uniref:MobQ family relaxase n=1 Tax=Enterobacter cloacae TaxID=550 RepID=UPI00292C2964|nr:MobQ family relaxase [Enterobacter cloacae]MDV0880483.1 MobQ family relaxase [Enterobacter cloacae]